MAMIQMHSLTMPDNGWTLTAMAMGTTWVQKMETDSLTTLHNGQILILMDSETISTEPMVMYVLTRTDSPQ